MKPLDDKRLGLFWIKVTKIDGGCWTWQATKSIGGYGMFRHDGRMQYAHVVSYEIAIGPKPVGSDLDHLCRNRACVNPAHLEAVSHRENCQRGDVGKGSGAQKKAKTHCPKGHSYEDAYTTKGYRQCRSCQREYSRLWKQRKRDQRGQLGVQQ